MTKIMTILRNIATLTLVTASATLPAAAATLPHLGSFFHRDHSNIAKAADRPTVTMTFRNSIAQQRELQVENVRYALRPGATLRISMNVGSPVFVSSNVNSHIHGVLLTASAETALAEVVLK